MASSLSLSFLGGFSAMWEGQPLRFATTPARALFAYLAVEADRPQPRAHLAELFWPEQAATISFNNLRQTLMRVRKAIPNPPGVDAVLDITKATLQFKRPSAACDVHRFEDLLAECALHTHAGTSPHADLVSCPECMGRMHEAAALYQGEFLSGLALDNSQPFEEWLLFKREQLHRQALEALNVLTQHYEATGQFEAMRECAARQLALDPWREEAHAQVMRALAYSGDRAAALAQFETCRRLLEAELGIEPTGALRALAERIRAGELAQPNVTARPTPAQITSLDWPEIPETGPLFGRERELAQLRDWLVRDRSRLVWLLGMGGVGKTSLAAAAASANAGTDAGAFDRVFWRSLLNAPPLEEVLRAAVQMLSRQRAVEFPATLDEQLAQLIGLLRERRCLLVLDNFESILDASEGKTYRPGYEAYDQLIQSLARSRHESCLLITSREQPRETARLSGSPGVHVLRLSGLAPDDGQALLAALQLSEGQPSPGPSAHAAALVQRYSGNPLALKLVAQTVQELFQGSIASFLAADAAIFDDVRVVLDQQFDRLSPLQQEVLMWLAVEREATTVSALRDNLAHPPSPHAFLEALRGLQRRSLLEQVNPGGDSGGSAGAVAAGGATAFTLQNVIMEYVTDRIVAQMTQEVGDLRLTTDDGAPSNRQSHIAQGTLNRLALVKARAKEYVMQSQVRLILQPVADRLLAQLGRPELERRLHSALAQLHALPPRSPGYAAGNILNLALHLGLDTSGFDFSNLSVWQADLRQASFTALNLQQSDLAQAAFIQAIDVGAVKYVDAGQMLVAGFEGGDLCLWRIADGQLQDAFRTPSRSGYPIVFSPNGRLLATCGLDYRIRVWSVATGALLQTLEGLTDQPFNPAFSHDGELVACGGRDGAVYVWRVQDGQALFALSVHESRDLITGLAFNPDGTILAGGGSGHVVWLWDLRRHEGRLITKLYGHARELETLAFSPDGAHLASGAHDGAIRVWDVSAALNAGSASGACVHELDGHRQVVRALTFGVHGQGHILASGSADRTIRLWDLRQRGEALHTLTGHAHEVTTLSFDRDDDVLASGSADKTIRRWDVRSGQALEIVSSYARMVDAVEWSPAAPVLASGGADGVLRLWNTEEGSVRHIQPRPAMRVLSLGFSPDGLRLASAGVDHAVHVWDVASGRAIAGLRGHNGNVTSVAFSPDGRLIASGSTDRTIRLWSADPAQPKSLGERVIVLSGHDDVIASVAFSPDGRWLVSASLDHTARVWDIAQCREVARLQGHTSALYGATYSPDGRWVVTNSWNYTVAVWDAATGQRVDLPGAAHIQARGIAFSPDGATVACVTKEQGIAVRQFYSGELLRMLRGHEMTIRSLHFNRTGAILASSDWDGVVRLWDAATGACIRVMRAQGPYAGMNIIGAFGISAAQKAALRELGAVSDT
jgi:WD40 repeat protein/DNA-binding SARP family transcriptional activator